jgi:hypothetical protein
MPLGSADVDAFADELYLGVTFAMLHDEQRVVCRASKAALEDRAAKDRLRERPVETFRRCRKEIERIASRKFDQGSPEPVVLGEDLAPIGTNACRHRASMLAQVVRVPETSADIVSGGYNRRAVW